MNNCAREEKHFIKMSKKKSKVDNSPLSIEYIKLKDNVKLPTNLFYCSKREENGKIVCKVFCDLDFTFESREEFLEYFDVEKYE